MCLFTTYMFVTNRSKPTPTIQFDKYTFWGLILLLRTQTYENLTFCPILIGFRLHYTFFFQFTLNATLRCYRYLGARHRARFLATSSCNCVVVSFTDGKRDTLLHQILAANSQPVHANLINTLHQDTKYKYHYIKITKVS